MIAGLLLANCAGTTIPDVWVSESEAGFGTQRGVTYYQGQPFSGWSFMAVPSGDTISITPYLYGRREGISQAWYVTGAGKEIGMYHGGNKTGEHRGWYEDGTVRFISHYREDVYHGNVKEWQSNGLLYRDFNYEDGHEKGLQQMWESDGRLKANYEVRNGRKYGLAGSMNCQSTAK
jgi:antitoxin component YwqK of YwqJK toxin-antitoxin module